MNQPSASELLVIVALGAVIVAAWLAAARLAGKDVSDPPRWLLWGVSISVAFMVVLVLQVPKRF